MRGIEGKVVVLGSRGKTTRPDLHFNASLGSIHKLCELVARFAEENMARRLAKWLRRFPGDWVNILWRVGLNKYSDLRDIYSVTHFIRMFRFLALEGDRT